MICTEPRLHIFINSFPLLHQRAISRCNRNVYAFPLFHSSFSLLPRVVWMIRSRHCEHPVIFGLPQLDFSFSQPTTTDCLNLAKEKEKVAVVAVVKSENLILPVDSICRRAPIDCICRSLSLLGKYWIKAHFGEHRRRVRTRACLSDWLSLLFSPRHQSFSCTECLKVYFLIWTSIQLQGTWLCDRFCSFCIVECRVQTFSSKRGKGWNNCLACYSDKVAKTIFVVHCVFGARKGQCLPGKLSVWFFQCRSLTKCNRCLPKYVTGTDDVGDENCKVVCVSNQSFKGHGHPQRHQHHHSQTLTCNPVSIVCACSLTGRVLAVVASL